MDQPIPLAVAIVFLWFFLMFLAYFIIIVGKTVLEQQHPDLNFNFDWVWLFANWPLVYVWLFNAIFNNNRKDD